MNTPHLLHGIIDTHIHTNPDTRKRRLNDLELAQEAARVGAKAIVIKSHQVSTMDRAQIAQFIVPDVKVFGGIVLNSYIGGINPAAVDIAIDLGAKFIWLPTAQSFHEKKLQEKNDGIQSVVDRKPIPSLVEILKKIAQANVILATGHLAPEETLIVVEAAKKLGVKKILINHPEWWSINMTLAQQKELSQYGVYFERCYATRPPGQDYIKNFETNLKSIEAIGYQSTILATDGGQMENPIWSDAYTEMITFFLDQGYSKEILHQITSQNAAQLLDI